MVQKVPIKEKNKVDKSRNDQPEKKKMKSLIQNLERTDGGNGTGFCSQSESFVNLNNI